VWWRDVAGRWRSGPLPVSFCQAGCIGLRMPTVCRRAISERCSELLSRHGRPNSTGICRRPFAASCSTIRRSAPTISTDFVWPTVPSRACACGCGAGRNMQGLRLRSPVGCSSVPPACGKTRCPISGRVGLWQPACPAFAMAADCATAARLAVRALLRSDRIALFHSNTAPSATLLSPNRRTRQTQAPGVSSG
jgi:hypothetical protein